MNESGKDEVIKASSEESRKKSCPSTPRDFFEKLYGHLDTEKKSQNREHDMKSIKNKNKLLGLTIHQTSPLKHFDSETCNQPTNWFVEKNDTSGFYQGFVRGEFKSDDQDGVNSSSEGEVDVESEDGEEDMSNQESTSEHLGVRQDGPIRYISQTLELTTGSTSDSRESKSLFARIPQERMCWKSTDLKLKSSELPTYPLHLPLMRSEEHHPFFLRPFQEGPYPPGLSAFCKYFENTNFILNSN